MRPRPTLLSVTEQEEAVFLCAKGKSMWIVSHILRRSPHILRRFLEKPQIAKQINLARQAQRSQL